MFAVLALLACSVQGRKLLMEEIVAGVSVTSDIRFKCGICGLRGQAASRGLWWHAACLRFLPLFHPSPAW